MTAIAVPVLNNFEGFTKMVHSLSPMSYPFYIYPNWDRNIGVGPAWNVLIGQAKADGVECLVVTNDDVIFYPDVIPGLQRLVKSGTDVASPVNETGVCHAYGLNFWCFAINPQTFFDKFGTFDENFAPAYYEDDDMAYRIKLARGRIFSAPILRAHHAVAGSETDPLQTDDYYSKNLEYYIKKWGGPPQHEKYRRPFNNDKMTLRDW